MQQNTVLLFVVGGKKWSHRKFEAQQTSPKHGLCRAVRSGPQDQKWTENQTELDRLGPDCWSWSFQFRRRRTDEKPVHLDRFRPVKDRTEVLVL